MARVLPRLIRELPVDPRTHTDIRRRFLGAHIPVHRLTCEQQLIEVPAHEMQKTHRCLLQRQQIPVVLKRLLRMPESHLRHHVKHTILDILRADRLNITVLDDIPLTSIGDQLLHLRSDVIHAGAGLIEEKLHRRIPDLLPRHRKIPRRPATELCAVLLPELTGEAVFLHELIELTALIDLTLDEHEMRRIRVVLAILEIVQQLLRCRLLKPLTAADDHEPPRVLSEGKRNRIQKIDQLLHIRCTIIKRIGHPLLAAEGRTELLLIRKLQVLLRTVEQVAGPKAKRLQILIQCQIFRFRLFLSVRHRSFSLPIWRPMPPSSHHRVPFHFPKTKQGQCLACHHYSTTEALAQSQFMEYCINDSGCASEPHHSPRSPLHSVPASRGSRGCSRESPRGRPEAAHRCSRDRPADGCCTSRRRP